MKTPDESQRGATFLQLCASQNDLFALDEGGDVYQYNFNTKTWLKLSARPRPDAVDLRLDPVGRTSAVRKGAPRRKRSLRGGNRLRLLSRSYGAETVAPSPAAEIVNVPLALGA